jgi:hypothetical protein
MLHAAFFSGRNGITDDMAHHSPANHWSLLQLSHRVIIDAMTTAIYPYSVSKSLSGSAFTESDIDKRQAKAKTQEKAADSVGATVRSMYRVMESRAVSSSISEVPNPTKPTLCRVACRESFLSLSHHSLDDPVFQFPSATLNKPLANMR